MHQVIRIIIYAQDKKDALEKGEKVLERLCGDGRTFDYFTLFNDNKATMSGKARWGSMPPVCLASSKEGKELIEKGMEATKEAFIKNISKIRKAINKFNNEELFNGRKEIKGENKDNRFLRDMFKYYCNCLGEYGGSNIWLYDSEGCGIKDEEQLKNNLDKYKCLYEDEGKENPHKDDKVFVIPADVHS